MTSPQVGADKGNTPRRGQLRHRGLLLAFAAVGAVTGAVAGELEFDVPQNVVSNYPTAIGSDVSAIVKKGEGKLYLNQNTAVNAFAGTITVENGVLGADDPQNFGKPSSVTVAKGGTLDLSPKSGNNAGSLRNAKVYLAGYGYANQGALRRTTGTMQDGLLNGFTLTDDTLVYNTTRFGTTGTIDFDGHYLEKQGPGGEFLLNGCTFKNFGGIILDGGDNGQLTIQGTGCRFDGGATNLLISKSGVLCLWNSPGVGSAPPWTIVVTNGLWMATGDTTKNRNAWDGPIEIATGKALTVNLTGNGTEMTYAGAMRNAGQIVKQGNANSTLNIVGDYQSVGSGNSNGIIDIRIGRVRFAGEGKTRELAQLTTANDYGEFVFDNAGYVHQYANNIWVAGKNNNLNTVSFSNTTFVSTLASDPKYNLFINLGDAAGYNGRVIVDAGSVLSNRFVIGKSGRGAVYQRGGTVNRQFAWEDDDTFGRTGYGFYGMDAGTLNFGYAGLGLKDANANAFMVQRGGASNLAGLELGRMGYGELYVGGGTAKSTADIILGKNEDTSAAGAGVLTVANGGELDIGRCRVRANHPNGFVATINLNEGGSLKTARITGGDIGSKSGSEFYLNCNGGKLCPSQAWGFTDQWSPAAGYDPTQTTIYDGGLTVDPSACASDKDWVRFPFPLVKPTGMGVASIELPPSDSEFWKSSFLGPTRVRISGKGKAATALVDFDLWTKKPRGVIVTGAGFGYDESTTAEVESWDGKTTYPCKVTMFAHKGTGGLTLTGTMGLVLPTACTYGGPTTVESGTLTFENNSYPAQSPLVLRPAGTVDFKGYPRTFASITGAGNLNNCNATVTNELCFYVADLKNGNALRLTGSLTLGANAKVRILDPENLDDSIKSLTLAVANGGVYGPASPTFEGANPDDWHVTIHGNDVRFGRRRGFGIFVR